MAGGQRVGPDRPRGTREGQVSLQWNQGKRRQGPSVNLLPPVLVQGPMGAPCQDSTCQCPTEVTPGRVCSSHPPIHVGNLFWSGGAVVRGRKGPRTLGWWTERNKPEVPSREKQLVANPKLLYVFGISVKLNSTFLSYWKRWFIVEKCSYEKE